jgi:hypothetical protein
MVVKASSIQLPIAFEKCNFSKTLPMPESRQRPGHHPHQKPADIPSSQRAKGRVLWALLFGAFGLLFAFFASGSYVAMAAGAVLGAVIGFYAGKSMEKEASHR